MMRRRVSLSMLVPLLFGCVAVACGMQAPPPPEPEPEPEPRPVERPRPEPKPVGWQVTIGEIGWEVVPPEPPDRAFKANTIGWQKHQKSDWEGSRPHFQEAVSIVTEYDLARYNLACAHSRLGDLDQALQEITHVLVRDLPRFKRAVHEDQDLGNRRPPADAHRARSRSPPQCPP